MKIKDPKKGVKIGPRILPYKKKENDNLKTW
jgi:hypothetical protein